MCQYVYFLLRYDHRERITAQAALCHAYFGSLRNTSLCSVLQSASIEPSKRSESEAQEVTAQTIYGIYYNVSSE